MSDLTPQAREIIAEEEQLLARVHAALKEKAPTRQRDDQQLIERLKDLREQAATAHSFDLPTIFQEMNMVRALLEHPQDEALPDWRSPYFAHLRLEEDDGLKDYCLGRVSFIASKQGVRVVDWRFAPVARIFYRYREGDTYEEQFPGRMAEGSVHARRVVVVNDGKLSRIITPHLTLARHGDTWAETGAGALLSGGAGTAARAGVLGVGYGATARAGREADISAMLDREQFDILSTNMDKPLLVLGSAGSGKTTVALHRMATLAFEHKERFHPSKMQVAVPEPGLARLSGKLLAPLGLSQVAVRTLDAWAKERFQQAYNKPDVKLWDDAPPAVSRLKRHTALFDALEKRVTRQGPTGYSGVRRELAELFTDRWFLKSVVDAAAGDLTLPSIDECVRHTNKQIASASSAASSLARGLTEVRREDTGPDEADLENPRDVIEVLEPGERESDDDLAGTIDVEDLPLFLYMRAKRSGIAGPKLAHMVLDEAEDLSLFELSVMRQTLDDKRSVTLAGDEAQQTLSSFAGWQRSLEVLGTPGAAICRLQVSYRCPRPIADLARHVLGPLAPAEPARAGREGAPVGRFDFPAEAHASLFLVDAIRDLVDREPHASVGVVARNAESARAFYKLVEDLPQSRLVLDGDFSFEPGIDVTDVVNVKGLEFDYVIVPDASAQNYPLNDEARRMLHVAVTRASHQLWVCSIGMPSPILANAPGVTAQ